MEQLETAGKALRLALEALSAARPNSRDYYVKPGSLKVAEEEHRSRVERVHGVYQEILTIYAAVIDQ